jgi:hypothetical protein
VSGYDKLVTLKQLGHLLLRQPNGLVLHRDLDACFAIFCLIKNELFETTKDTAVARLQQEVQKLEENPARKDEV